MHDDFRVRGGFKGVTSGDQLFAQLNEVVNFPVQDAGYVLVLVKQRLASGDQVDNAQPGVAEPHRIVDEDRAIVRAAQGELGEHRIEGLPRDRLRVRFPIVSEDSAHGAESNRRESTRLVHGAEDWRRASGRTGGVRLTNPSRRSCKPQSYVWSSPRDSDPTLSRARSGSPHSDGPRALMSSETFLMAFVG